MKALVSLMALLLLALAGGFACAQGTDAPTDYVIGADDILDISVDNHIDLNRTVTVLPDGKISFPEVGDIQASGKTPKEVAEIIKTGLEKTRNKVDVVVAIKEVKSKRVRIVGAVKASGSYDLKPGFRLMDVVALAGGLSNKPTRITGRLVSGTKVTNLDMVKAVFQPDSEANPVIKNNDLVLLDETDLTRQVHVLGEVNKPGAYDLTENMTVVSLISEASSVTDKAWLSQAYVMRGTEKLPLNLVNVLLKNETDDPVTKFKLQPGDVLMVPEAEQKYAVLGQVNKPGFYPVPEKKPITVLEALSLAGGQTQEAEMRKAGILRTVNGKPVGTPINLDEVMRKGNLTKNVTLQPGDILFVPSRPRREVGLVDFLNPVSFLISLLRY